MKNSAGWKLASRSVKKFRIKKYRKTGAGLSKKSELRNTEKQKQACQIIENQEIKKS